MPSRSFIVGDAGGTGTQWRIFKNGDIAQYETIGYNAYTHDVKKLKKDINQVFGSEIQENIPTYFYAAGLDTQEQIEEAVHSLSEIFGEHVVCNNDLIGVARSLCGKESGNVCILGTGANACYYDGNSVNKVSASLGYVLGDEGSGADLGKRILKSVFRNHISPEIVNRFQDRFKLTSHHAILKIYNETKPNHFLASFAPFLHENRNHPEVYELIRSSFHAFFDGFFKDKLPSEVPFYFSGSIAYHFSDILREVGAELSIVIKNISQSPISGLVLYHQEYGE